MIEITVYEAGNGFPHEGAYVASAEQLYRVASRHARIHTDRHANYMHMSAVAVDWDECTTGHEFPCIVEEGWAK